MTRVEALRSGGGGRVRLHRNSFCRQVKKSPESRRKNRERFFARDLDFSGKVCYNEGMGVATQGVKVALVCDWLTNVGGAEKVLLAIHQMFPEAPIFTSQYNPRKIDWFRDAEVRTGWMQALPAGMRRLLAPARARYFRKLDLSEYDLVISVTGAEAKGVKFKKETRDEGAGGSRGVAGRSGGSKGSRGGVHICYCHVPTQYYWQMYEDYVRNPGFGALNFAVRPVFKALVGRLRKADYAAAQRPTEFVTISRYAREQIREYYGREARVVAPGVEVEEFRRGSGSEDLEGNSGDGAATKDGYFLNFSRQVGWKRLDLAILACVEAGEKLVLVGDGPEHGALVRLAEERGAGELVEFRPAAGREELKEYLSGAKAFVFPSLEPFGIAPVEALAAGVPVIAYAEGGAKDYVKNGKNGLLFKEQTAESLAAALRKFERVKLDGAEEIARSAEYYAVERFKREMREVVSEWI